MKYRKREQKERTERKRERKKKVRKCLSFGSENKNSTSSSCKSRVLKRERKFRRCFSSLFFSSHSQIYASTSASGIVDNEKLKSFCCLKLFANSF